MRHTSAKMHNIPLLQHQVPATPEHMHVTHVATGHASIHDGEHRAEETTAFKRTIPDVVHLPAYPTGGDTSSSACTLVDWLQATGFWGACATEEGLCSQLGVSTLAAAVGMWPHVRCCLLLGCVASY